MAAYASLVSLMQIFDQIEHHPSPPISMDKKQVESLTEIVVFLQEFLEGYKSPFADSDEADPLEMRIADAVYAAEDAIESHIVDQILSEDTTDQIISEETMDQSSPAASEDKWKWIGFFNCFGCRKEPKQNYGSETTSEDMCDQIITAADLYESLENVIKDMYLIKEEVMDMVAVKDQLQTQVFASTGSSMLRNNSSSSSLSRLNSTTMVGCDDVMLHLMDKLTDGRPGRHVIPIFGMGGIGKTTLARNVYEKPLISQHFDFRAWVTISQQFNSKELLCEILFQANKKELKEILSHANKQGKELKEIMSQADKQGKELKEALSQMSEGEIGVALHKYLSYRRFFVVLDDMWSVEAWEKLQCYFPNNNNCSRIMVTTRLSNLGSQLDDYPGLKMKFLEEESSWNMFCKIVFGGRSCPLELEKIGRKIVESCRGLPLSIVVMGGVLGKLDPTKECWESIRGSINSLVNLENDKHCLKILKLSYNHLLVYLKPCFLYMGMYEEDSLIRVSAVIKLWVSEGFLKPISGKSLETVAKEYLDELVDRNLILVHEFGKTGNMKYLKIHDLLRDLCLREAKKERFYHVVGEHSLQGTCSQRRVVVPSSTSMEKVLDGMRSTPHARSYISHDRERVRGLPNSKLLRILEVSPAEENYVFSPRNMLNLRFLNVYSGQVRPSIKLMWSLQTFVDCHHNGNFVIGSMPQLRHVHAWELHLQDHPSDNTVIMENLQTLKTVRNFKCDEMMVRRIPNIKKLVLTYYENGDYCLHNIEHLQKLEYLSCHCSLGGDDSQKLTFPHSLKSLTLKLTRNSRMEDIMEKVSTLPLLQKLKLYDGDFTTRKWETVDGQFLSLKYLSLKNCGQLECWMMESSHFPCLEHLYLCYLKDLEEIPVELGEIPTLKSLALECCSESAVKSAKRMVEEQEELQGEEQLSFKVAVEVLWDQYEELKSLANTNFEVTLSMESVFSRALSNQLRPKSLYNNCCM